MIKNEIQTKSLRANLKELIKKYSPEILSWIQIILFFVIYFLACKYI